MERQKRLTFVTCKPIVLSFVNLNDKGYFLCSSANLETEKKNVKMLFFKNRLLTAIGIHSKQRFKSVL